MNGRLQYVGFLLILLTGCGGSLSNEQRQEMKDARSKQEIRKVTEAELIEEAIKSGRELVEKAKPIADDIGKLEALARTNNARIKLVEAGSKNALEIEKQIIDAYVVSIALSDLPENIQMIGDDSLLYSQPVVEHLPEGAVQIKGIWSITFSKKDIVLSMSQ